MVTPVAASPERITILETIINELWQQYHSGQLTHEQRIATLNSINSHQTELDSLRAPAETPAQTFAPNPRLVSPQNITVTAGESVDVALTIRNIGTHTAFNYLLQAVPNGPFSIEFLNNSNIVNSITENRNITVTIRITVSANAETGNHTIALTHNFRTQDRDNESRADTPIQVRVVGAEDDAATNLEIRNLTAPTGNIPVNGMATISFYVHNAGPGTARNFNVRATPEVAAAFRLEQTTNPQTIASLAPGESRRLTFNFVPLRAASTDSYTISFTVTHGDVEFSQTTSINVFNPEEDGARANLEIRNMSAPTGNIYVGQTAAFSFYVYNSGEGIARNFSVRATPEVAAAFRLEQTTNPQIIPSLAPGESRRLTFNFVPLRAASTDSYTISFTVTGEDTEFGQTASINVVNPDEENDVRLTIRNMSAPTGRVNVGSTAAISFYVHNPGESTARNIRVAAAPESTDLLLLTATPQSIPNLGPGESHRVTFNVTPRPEASTGSNLVSFTVTCADGTEFSQSALINAYNPDEDAGDRIQIPRVIISNRRITPEIPRAGQPFDMEITFRNTSANRSVNNVIIVIDEVIGQAPPNQAAPFAGFSPVDGGNTLFIDYIPAHGEVTMNLRFNTVVDASPGAHNLRFSFDYQDQEFERHDFSEQISITVAQFSRMELRDVEVNPWHEPVMVGNPVRFSYIIINSGRTNLINVRTSAEGPFDRLHEAGMFMGQINTQRASTTFTGTFVPTEAGRQYGYFVVTAEDQTGEIIELRHPFYVDVMGDMEGGMFPGGDMGMGGDFGPGGGRPGMPGMPGMPEGEIHWCHETGNTYIGTRCFETWDFTPTHVMCHETGEWIEVGGGGFNFLALIRRPIVWGPAIGVVVIAAIVVIVIINKKRTKFSFMDDDDE